MTEDQQRFDEIIGEMNDLVREALSLLPDYEKFPELNDRAKSYWYAHLRTALCDENEFGGRSICNMRDTLEEWEELETVEDIDNEHALPTFSRQEEWDDYVARNGINEYEE